MDLALAARVEAVLNAHVAYLLSASWVRGDTGWRPPGETRERSQEVAVVEQLAKDKADLESMDRRAGARSRAVLRRMSPTSIIRFVGAHFHLSEGEVTGRDRHRDIALARHLAMYIIRKVLRLSFTRIGRLFGKRDHTSVMSAVQKIDAQRFTCQEVGDHLASLVFLDGQKAAS
jgi:chromosomal replication initiation ATPase DnaA